jgi:predicted small integral membrane protein
MYVVLLTKDKKYTQILPLGVDGGDNIQIDLQEVGWRHMGWIDLAQDRDRWQTLANALINFRVP